MLDPLLQLATPGTVAVALGAIGIIALIHWLARDRTPPIILPTARFIPRSDSAAITRRWRDALVFAWRSAFALLTIAAIALWLLPPPPTPGDHDPSAHDPRAPLVIVLDGSGSMREPLGAGTRFDAARAAAAEALNEAAARGQPVMLILAQRRSQTIPPLLSTDAPALLAALDELRHNDAHADLARAIAHAEDRLNELRIDRADLLLLTDGQRASTEGLADLSADLHARWRTTEARSFAAPRTEPRLWWIAEDPTEAPAFAQRITLGIDNPADESRIVTLTLRTTLGTDRQRITLAPNDSQTLAIPITPTEPGPWEALATLDSAPDAPLLIVGHTPPPIEVLLLDDAAKRYAGALDPRDPDEQRDTYWPLRITPSPMLRHSMPHEQAAIHIARPSTILQLSSPAPRRPRLLLADSPREIEHIAAQLGITIPTIGTPRTAELATPARAAGLALSTLIAPHWWARSLSGTSVAATDDLGRPLALRTSLLGSPTIVLLGEPDRRDVRLPLLLLELLAPLTPAQANSAATITAGQSATLLIEPPAAQQLPLALIGPNKESLQLTTTPLPDTGLLRLAIPPLDVAGLWRIESSDGRRIASVAVTPDPREVDAAMVDAATLRARLGGEQAPGTGHQAPVGESASGIRDQATGVGAPADSGLPLLLFIIAIALLVSEPLLGRALGDVARPMSMLTALRLLAMLMLIITAWLAWHQHQYPDDAATPTAAPSPDRPTLHILLDRSDSMGHSDERVRPSSTRTRQASAEAWIRAVDEAGLETHARQRIVPFPTQRTDHTPLLDTLDATLAEALPGDALVILSDGADTTPDPLRRSARAEQLAQRAAALNIPIHAYPLGDTDQHHEATLHASITIDPPTITPGTPTVARIEVHAINPADQQAAEVPTRLRIIAAPPAPGDPTNWPDQQVLLDATLPVPPGGLSFELPITPPPPAPASPSQRWLAVHLTADAAHRPPRATEALAIARIDREPKRILLLEGNPAPATRRTIQALARTPGLIVEAGQSLGPRIDFARWQLDPEDPANLQRTMNLPWPPAFAPGPGGADLIILGNRLDRLLTPGEAAALATRIEQGTPVIHLNPPRSRDEQPGSATQAILAEALAAAPPEPLFVDDRLGLGDDRWIAGFVRRAIDPGDATAPIQLLTPARPIRPGASPTIGVLLADPDAPAPTLRLTSDAPPDRPLPLTRSPGTPGLWLARLPAFSTPSARPFRLIAETDSHAAEAWLSIDGRSPEAARGLLATDHELLRVIAEGSGGVLSLEPVAAVELLAVILEQLESDRSMNESGWAGFPAPQGFGWLIAALVGLTGGLIALWTARRWRGLA